MIDLDFSVLDNIGRTSTEADKERKPERNTAPAAVSGSLQRQADITKKTFEQAREVWSIYQKNVRKSEVLKTNIVKGVQRGEDLESLFLQAVEVIGLLTDDNVMLNQVTKDLEKRGELPEKTA